MKKAQSALNIISCIAFYIGAICFFIDGNQAAGAMGTAAGTLFLSALLMRPRKEEKQDAEHTKE